MNDLDFQVGEKVIIWGESYGAASRIDVVERLTKTQIITKNSGKFSRRHGAKIGAYGFWVPSIRKPKSEEEIKTIENAEHKRDLVAAVSKTNWSALEPRKLEKILSILREHP